MRDKAKVKRSIRREKGDICIRTGEMEEQKKTWWRKMQTSWMNDSNQSTNSMNKIKSEEFIFHPNIISERSENSVKSQKMETKV